MNDAIASAAFYEAVFGFSVYSDQEITLREGSPVRLGPTDSPRPGRFLIMKGSHPLAGMIGLISIKEPVKNCHADGRLGVGNVVLVVEVEDIEATKQTLKESKGQVLMDLHDAENTGDENGQKIPSRRIFGADPDGYVLEIFQPN